MGKFRKDGSNLVILFIGTFCNRNPSSGKVIRGDQSFYPSMIVKVSPCALSWFQIAPRFWRRFCLFPLSSSFRTKRRIPIQNSHCSLIWTRLSIPEEINPLNRSYLRNGRQCFWKRLKGPYLVPSINQDSSGGADRSFFETISITFLSACSSCVQVKDGIFPPFAHVLEFLKQRLER